MTDIDSPAASPTEPAPIAPQGVLPKRPPTRPAQSKSLHGVSEIAVMSPIRTGCVAGERRTYEERLRGVIDNLAERHRQGLPIELNRIPAIHFGRLMIIRPEQYLMKSTGAATYFPDQAAEPMDDFTMWPGPSRHPPRADDAPQYRSFLLTLVEFDGDLRVYMRDIAEFLARDFDKVFENCDDYPGTKDFEAFWLWIKRYQINTDLFYAPYAGLSTVRIRHLAAFKAAFDAFVAKVRSPTGRRVGSMDELFDDFLRQNLQIASGFPTPGGLYNPDDRG